MGLDAPAGPRPCLLRLAVPARPQGPALLAGAFLAGLDLAVENAGGALGLWTTHGALWSVGVTPVEVLVLAFLAGAGLSGWTSVWPFGTLSGLGLLALGGAGLEAGLVHLGMMAYHAPWSPIWAVLAYVLALAATLAVHRLAAARMGTSTARRPVEG